MSSGKNGAEGTSKRKASSVAVGLVVARIFGATSIARHS
jgi:hypothetical protein